MYYFLWGTKRIPYSSVRSIRRVALSTLRGTWGTASPRYWASLDPQRPKKSASLILDGDRYVRHVVTPEDPDAVEAIIREHVQLGRETDASEDGPLIRLAGAVSQYESRP